MKNYRFGFDIWAMVLFFVIMIPNIIWMSVPPENDALRIDSVTPVIDFVASVSQVLMIAVLCFIKKEAVDNRILLIPLTIIMTILYYVFWGLYYGGIVNFLIILGLSVLPCVAFLAYALFRRNNIALFPLSVFTICHIAFAIINFADI